LVSQVGLRIGLLCRGRVFLRRHALLYGRDRVTLVAEPLLRRMMNQAIFRRLLITEDGVQEAELEIPFADLLADGFATDLQAATAALLAPQTPNPPSNP
jgi:hypothetical protein